ncbi:alpha/beta hydrolase [Streptomyces sp. Go40/10]|uniref:alpha/beta hydrolase n=1 Tax=Streptomyces sp. Go40/10 TaxID=2825844 RepID=UPI002111BBE5|nr:alpha/beta hydrolase [Streptomyces sp. Go40/10]
MTAVDATPGAANPGTATPADATPGTAAPATAAPATAAPDPDPAAPRTARKGPDRTDLDRAYSPSSRVTDLGVHLTRYATDSARARAELTVHLDLPCGPRPEQRLDLFPAADPGAPLFVFVHGGYWQELSKSEAAFAARDFVAAGISFAALGYGLAPRHRMRDISAAVSDALHRIATGRAPLPIRPRAVHLGGHSAGAHLVASALLDAADRQAPGTFASATLLSGVYDLEPLRHTYVNDALGMDAGEARDCSPQLRMPACLPPLVVALAENDTDAFAAQHHRFVAAAREGGTEVTDLVVPGRHHFDLPFDLADPDTVLGAAVLRIR